MRFCRAADTLCMRFQDSRKTLKSVTSAEGQQGEDTVARRHATAHSRFSAGASHVVAVRARQPREREQPHGGDRHGVSSVCVRATGSCADVSQILREEVDGGVRCVFQAEMRYDRRAGDATADARHHA